MFQRHRRDESAATTSEPVVAPGAKGRPTPSRREAEAARRERMKPTLTRKEQAKRAREQRYEARMKQRAAMDSGDEKYLPRRDSGPVRRFVRDYVDARRNVAEYLLPILVAVLALSLIPAAWAAQAVFLLWAVTIIGTLGDTFWFVSRLRKRLKEAFPNEVTKGAVGYGVLRTTQIRRFRLPKPQVERGAKVEVHR
ncbi:DUF3043 domain-containing protein [Solicola sp. PLA-1-18]|uniref:DUF3043 domain-containing protein n=1 Tax=Solicola sp. PLA-1-18 TaxID=3380532 RepID=UPI003B81FFEE